MIAQRQVLARLAMMTLVCGIGMYGADAARAQDCSNEAGLKSASQGAPVELSFRNASSETRRLYWMDQNGNRKFISLIRPSSIYIQPTAATHSWVVTDDHEKCLNAITASAEPQTVDVGGQTVARAVTPPGIGTQESIAAAAPPDAATAPSADPAQSPEPVQNTEPTQNPEPAQSAQPLLNAAPAADPSVADAGASSLDSAQEDLSVQVPQVSPIEQFNLNGSIRVLAVAEEGKSLNNQATGTVEVVRVNPEWDSGQWVFEPVVDSPFVRIKNNWKRTYLTDVNGQLRAVAAPTDADPSHWSIEPVDGTAYVQLRNRETDRFLLNLNGVPNLANDYRQDQERQTYWQLNPAGEAVAVAAPRIAALASYNSAVTDCRDIGGVWTGSSCRSNYAAMGYAVAQPLACPRGWFWDQESGECLYEVAGSAAACPPWQQGPGGQCVSNLVCRGGQLRTSRRGASCDCPFGMAPWGNYPNLSCKPSVARIVPLLLMSKFGGSLNHKHGDKRFALGQAYGNKQFGKNQQTNVNNSTGLIIKVSKPVNTPTNLGNNTKPVIVNPVISTPIVFNPNGPKPNVNNTNVVNTNVNNTNVNNPGGTKPVGILTNPTNTNTNTNINTGTKPTTPVNNPTAAEKKEADTLTKALNGSPSEKANAVAFCNANPNSVGCKIALPATGNVANTSPNTRPGTGNTPTNTNANSNTNTNPALDKAVADFNKLSPQQKASTLSACQNNNSPGCTAIKQSAGLPTGQNANTSGNTGINPNLPINPNNRPGNTSATTTNATTTTNTGTQNNQGRPGTGTATTTTTTTTTSNNNPSQNNNPSDTANNNAIQRACQANPNLPICRGQQNTNNGRITPPGTNPNLPPNNQQVQNDAKAKADAEAKARADAAAAAKLKADAEAKARADATAKQNADAANRAKVEADNRAKADAVAKQNADAKAKADAAARQNAEAAARNKAAADAAAAARNKAAADAAAAARNKAAADVAARNRAAAEAAARANQARLNAANQARINAANQARQNAANQARANNSRQQSGGCPPGRRRLPNGACG